MPKVYMFPNPRFGMPARGATDETEKSVYLADPLVADMPGVNAVLAKTARTIGARASARLNTVKALSETSKGPEGSQIEVHQGAFIDWYIVLDDERDDYAAGAINNEHGILEAATPIGRAALARPAKYVDAPLRKPPAGLEVFKK